VGKGDQHAAAGGKIGQSLSDGFRRILPHRLAALRAGMQLERGFLLFGKQSALAGFEKLQIESQLCAGAVVFEVQATGLPAGLGEPVFDKLDAELGRMLGIGAVKAIEIGAGMAVKDMTGSQTNDIMHNVGGKVVFDTNNAGGITGGLSTGQELIVRLAVKPTPTIDKKQQTIDKYTQANKELAAITRRDPTIVARIWPVAENYTALVLLDHLMAHLGYQAVKKQLEQDAAAV
jgi:chorismate synthase